MKRKSKKNSKRNYFDYLFAAVIIVIGGAILLQLVRTLMNSYHNSSPTTSQAIKPVIKIPQISTYGWKEYANEDFHFSFKYPPNWFISPTIVSKEQFDNGNYEHGDFMGITFFIDPRMGPFRDQGGMTPDSNTPGDVVVEMYKKQPSKIQVNSRPVDCRSLEKPNVIFGCTSVSYSDPYRDDYIESNEYVFELSSQIPEAAISDKNAIENFAASSLIIDSFTITGK